MREELEYKGNTELGKDLLKEAGQMGLLMADIPEAYGGMGRDKATIMLISEKIAAAGSFAVTHGAQSGIGTLPIVYFGTEEQKQEYLPGLATGETADLLRPDRTGQRQRRPGRGHHRRADRRRQALRPERHQAVHHQRRLRRDRASSSPRSTASSSPASSST